MTWYVQHRKENWGQAKIACLCFVWREKMRTLVKTGNLTREEWLKWRTKGIGGSEVSVIAGLNKFRSVFQLWLEKTGQTIPEESENKFTHFGNVVEPIVKKEFCSLEW